MPTREGVDDDHRGTTIRTDVGGRNCDLVGTNIVSTTPETDTGNTNTANKGVLEQNTDVDVFSFVTGSGPVQLTLKMASFWAAFSLVASRNPVSETATTPVRMRMKVTMYLVSVTALGLCS